MQEIILQNKKHGMRVLLLSILVELLSLAGIIVAAVMDTNGYNDGIWIPLVIISKKKKVAALEAEATVNAYKHKIDTTDDKTIDVYADEEAVVEETAEETVEAPVETEEPAQDNE